jgi:selenide,water dikinase
MDAAALAQVLRGLPPIDDPNVLVGTDTGDDAGVYRMNSETALVQTVDFFTPIVDDPYTYGAIAAANALSDVYAMGAQPISALAIVAFPEHLDRAILEQILRGGSDKAREAGIFIIGGHSIKDDEPKYGLAVTGIVRPDRIVRNSTAKAGDLIYLTKAVGTGILTTAARKDAIPQSELAEAVKSMWTLNATASRAMIRAGARAATDVTGFGLIGHLSEMTRAAKVGARIDAARVPRLSRALELARAGCVPGGTRTNLAQALERGVTFASIDEALQLVLCDAQTSGGLLVAIPPDRAADFERFAREDGLPVCSRIGEFTPSSEGAIRVQA